MSTCILSTVITFMTNSIIIYDEMCCRTLNCMKKALVCDCKITSFVTDNGFKLLPESTYVEDFLLEKMWCMNLNNTFLNSYFCG